MMSTRVCPASKTLHTRAPATLSRAVAAPVSRCISAQSSKNTQGQNHENKAAASLAAGIVAAGLLLGQPVFAAGLLNPDGTAAPTPKLGEVVNKTLSKLFPEGAFDKALEVDKARGSGGNASLTEPGEYKGVTQLLNEVAEPSPARKSPIARAARKFEPDVDPTYEAKPKKDKGQALAGVESEAPVPPTTTAGSSIGNPPNKM